jgi:DNA mismatch repair protein MutS
VPKTVIKKARQRLLELEASAQRHAEQQQNQLPLFNIPAEPVEASAVEIMLEQIDPDELTPRQALEQLYQLKEELKSREP